MTEPTKKRIMPLRIIAIVITSPAWLCALAIALPFALVVGAFMGFMQLLNYAAFGEWIKKGWL